MTKEKNKCDRGRENGLKSKAGRPKGFPTTKPSLRIDGYMWNEMKKKYPGQVNKMFCRWVFEQLEK